MNLREAIQDISKDKLRFDRVIVATVKSVEGDQCTVLSESETEIPGVRLQMDPSAGVLYMPKVGSVVLLLRISDFDFSVVMFSALDEIKFLNGSYGGLVKAPELKEQLDKTNEVVNAIAQTLQTWTPVSNDGGAALKTAAIAALTGKVVGDYSNIENDKVSHGTSV